MFEVEGTTHKETRGKEREGVVGEMKGGQQGGAAEGGEDPAMLGSAGRTQGSSGCAGH